MTAPARPSSPKRDGEQGASRERDAPSASRSPIAVEALRCAFSLLGGAIAILAATTMDAGAIPVYVTYFILAFLFEFVWLGSRFPFAVPYYTAMNAFAYIGGPAIVTLEYLQRLISYPMLAWLVRIGVMSMPLPLAPVLGRDLPQQQSRLRAWIDHGTAGTIGALSVLCRFWIFTLVRTKFHVGLIPAIAIAEYGTLGILGLMHSLVPLPMTEELRLGGRWRWRLDDERVDLVVVVILVAPIFVFVINLAYALEGLPGAIGFSLATLGPHVLMKLSNDRLGRLSELLEKKQHELKDLVHTVAHDLKSPISAALLTTDLVLDRDARDLDGETRQDLARVVRLLARAEDMVRDLLRVFRIVWEAERWTEVELDALIDRILESISAKAALRGATVSVSSLPVLWGQASKLEHALSNLLENAVRHLPEEGGMVSIDAEVTGTVATLRVRDNGCGIPPDYLGRIFQLYAQVPKGIDSGGSGVGLAIVKRVVDSHAGRVWVESEVGSGSCFFLELPGVVASPAKPIQPVAEVSEQRA